ncbi:MAG: rhomboid family intramembrane serine protease [Bacteroidetes bacterium]|nr:MAG: rhomboid family intramembrane serine protease [Bacteroidota bacterium]
MLSSLCLYNGLRWLLDIKWGILNLNEDLLNFWIPGILSALATYIWLWPRIKILAIRGSRDKGHFLYSLIMTLAIVIPVALSQDYLSKAFYKLNNCTTVESIPQLKDEKYFVVKQFRIAFGSVKTFITSRTSGRNNENLNFSYYYACPFQRNGNIWYGVSFTETISNNYSDNYKEQVFHDFVKRSELAFQTMNFDKFRYLEKLPNSTERKGFLNAIKTDNPKVKDSEQIILIPQTRLFEERINTSPKDVLGIMGIGLFVFFWMVLIPKIDEKAYVKFLEKKHHDWSALKQFIKSLNPLGQSWGFANLILINVLVFLYMVFVAGVDLISATPQELKAFGGVSSQLVMEGDYWRLFTAIFVHGGLMHIGYNLFAFFIAFALIDELLGSRGALFISYLFCGLFGSLSSIYWHDNVVSVGASGAIFGLFGIASAFTLWKVFPGARRSGNWSLIGLIVIPGLLLGLIGNSDNAAHIGGLISGFLIGSFVAMFRKLLLPMFKSKKT